MNTNFIRLLQQVVACRTVSHPVIAIRSCGRISIPNVTFLLEFASVLRNLSLHPRWPRLWRIILASPFLWLPVLSIPTQIFLPKQNGLRFRRRSFRKWMNDSWMNNYMWMITPRRAANIDVCHNSLRIIHLDLPGAFGILMNFWKTPLEIVIS